MLGTLKYRRSQLFAKKNWRVRGYWRREQKKNKRVADYSQAKDSIYRLDFGLNITRKNVFDLIYRKPHEKDDKKDQTAL